MKRLLLILAIGISFAPAVFAAGTGPFNRSSDASTAGAAHCKAGIHETKVVADSDSGKKDKSEDSTESGGAI